MQLQETVAQFAQMHKLDTALVPARVLDMTSEVGELAKEVLKGTAYGRHPFQPTEGWAGELGDIYFSLICIANSTGVNLEAALGAALEKYRQRLASIGNPGSEG